MFGKPRQERGEFTEHKVMAAFRDAVKLPSWLISCEKVSPELDAKGIDFVIESDVGRLNLQVKSSRAGRESHKEKYEGKFIAVVVVDINDTSEKVLGKCIVSLGTLRKQILKHRNGKG